MTEEQRSDCQCALRESASPSVVAWQCGECFRIWRAGKRLVSVGRVIRETFPQPKELPPPEVLENARHRGEQTDALFSLYVMGQLRAIPAGTRIDVYNPEPPRNGLLQKLMRWFDRQNFKSVQSQILLSTSTYCGVCDLCFDGMWVDLKSVYSLSREHEIQVGGYCYLADMGDKQSAALLHVTERIAEPRLVSLDVKQIKDDFATTRSMYELIQRRTRNGTH